MTISGGSQSGVWAPREIPTQRAILRAHLSVQTRDIPNATVRLFDTGHFALETHAEEIAAEIRDFLAR